MKNEYGLNFESNQRIGEIESGHHARESVVNIRHPRPQLRFRRPSIVSSTQKLLESAALFLLHGAGGLAVGGGRRSGGLFASSASVQEAILDALRLEERRRSAGFRSASTACARHDCARSLHGEDEVRALDSQRFRAAPELG